MNYLTSQSALEEYCKEYKGEDDARFNRIFGGIVLGIGAVGIYAAGSWLGLDKGIITKGMQILTTSAVALTGLRLIVDGAMPSGTGEKSQDAYMRFDKITTTPSLGDRIFGKKIIALNDYDPENSEDIGPGNYVFLNNVEFQGATSRERMNEEGDIAYYVSMRFRFKGVDLSAGIKTKDIGVVSNLASMQRGNQLYIVGSKMYNRFMELEQFGDAFKEA